MPGRHSDYRAVAVLRAPRTTALILDGLHDFMEDCIVDHAPCRGFISAFVSADAQ